MTDPLDRIEEDAKFRVASGRDVLALVAVARTAEEVVATADAERWDVLLANGGLMIDALREALSRLGGAAGKETG